MSVFADTSALLKRYLDEAGTDLVADVLRDANSLAVSVLTLVEATSALTRRTRQGDISEVDYKMIHGALFDDLADAEMIPIGGELIHVAMQLVERRHLRTLDAIQLASALGASPRTFLCSDRSLAAAAEKEGLAVVIPG